MANDRRLSRIVIFVLVAGAHMILLMLPLEPERRQYEHGGSARRTVLFFPRVPIQERRALLQPRPPAEPEIQTNIAIDTPSSISVGPVDGTSTAISGAEPSIDWTEEARRAAAAAADKVPIPDRNKCDATGLADPALPNCKPRPQFRWAPPRAGFSDGLPYVRLGDRCVVGLGFFGCSLSKPPARDDLFEGMDDPERDRSSVPDANP